MKWKIALALLILGVGYLAFTFSNKYHIQAEMTLPIKEIANFDYPDDPALLSTFYNRYGERSCKLEHKGGTQFDLIFDSPLPQVAKVTLRNLDFAFLLPVVPSHLRGDRNLEVITLVEREWNRQQVSFDKSAPQLTIEGGDGYESSNLLTAEISRNCLNAGLFEMLLFVQEEGEKRLLYHGWFDFPLGYYKKLLEELNGISYWRDWFRLEHWVSPAGKTIALDKLRTPLQEQSLRFDRPEHERIVAKSEQQLKLRLMEARPVIYWQQFPTSAPDIHFTTFVPPGLYDGKKKWSNEYARIETLESVTHRRVRSPLSDRPLDELELTFNGLRFIVGGVDFATLPTLDPEEYAQGLYMPMGIAMPPFYQSYRALEVNPPALNPYYALLLSEKGGWLDHHKVGIDGPVLFRDLRDPQVVHLYFLSYERIALVAHFVLSL